MGKHPRLRATPRARVAPNFNRLTTTGVANCLKFPSLRVCWGVLR